MSVSVGKPENDVRRNHRLKCTTALLVCALGVGHSSAGPDHYGSVAARGPAASLRGADSLPDLDIRLIGMTPRLPWNGAKKWPVDGETVTFEGQVANRGGTAAGRFVARWSVDGQVVAEVARTDLAPDAETVLRLPWRWLSGRHDVRLELDPGGAIAEVSETNNDLTVPSNGITFGMWVERSVYDFFNAHVHEAGWGGNGFDDWVQRNIAIWNTMMAEAQWPSSPDGIVDRVRVDKIAVVPDGALRCSTNRPVEDYEVDLQWGLPSEVVGVASPARCDWLPTYRDNRSVWDRELGILHEVSHARYLVDLYGFNVQSQEDRLAQPLSAIATSVELERAPDIPEFQAKSHFIIDGEILFCAERSGTRFSGCQRGARRTTARAHAAGAAVFGDQMFVTDGRGNALAGSPALPAPDGTFHRQADFGQDLMNAGEGYGEHSAFAWNRIAGQRARCGNYNVPCNIGAYLADIPTRNRVALQAEDGTPLAGAQVAVHRARPYAIWYGKTYQEPPDALLTTDDEGRIDLGGEPLGAGGIVHTFGHSNGVLLLVVTAGERVGTAFLDLTTMNVAYARGARDEATYPLRIRRWSSVDVALPTLTPEPPTPTPTPVPGDEPLSVAVDARKTWQTTSVGFEPDAEMLFEVVRGRWTHWIGSVPYNPGVGGDYTCGLALPPEQCAEPVPEVASGALIGRVGAWAFGIGQGRGLRSTAGGALTLRINDAENGLGDNDGILSVRTGVRSDVGATSGWQSTGLVVNRDTLLDLTVVEGLWTHDVGVVPPNPGVGGDYVCADHMPAAQCGDPLPTVAQGQLIGRIGGTVFGVGAGARLTTASAGLLEVRINDADGGLADNDGTLRVRVWAGPGGIAAESTVTATPTRSLSTPRASATPPPSSTPTPSASPFPSSTASPPATAVHVPESVTYLPLAMVNR